MLAGLRLAAPGACAGRLRFAPDPRACVGARSLPGTVGTRALAGTCASTCPAAVPRPGSPVWRAEVRAAGWVAVMMRLLVRPGPPAAAGPRGRVRQVRQAEPPPGHDQGRVAEHLAVAHVMTQVQPGQLGIAFP